MSGSFMLGVNLNHTNPCTGAAVYVGWGGVKIWTVT